MQTNPEPRDAEDYDLIVVGGGSGGLGATGIARAFGLRSLLIEAKAENIGGDCLNYGCVPSKSLIHVSRLARHAREARAFGLEVAGQVDFAAALRYVHDAQARIRRHENAAYLRREMDQDVVIGWAKFVGADTLQVGERRFRGRRIVLATGSRPRKLDVPGIDAVEGLHTNHTFFERERALPRRLLIVGGGAIACEMGQAMQRLGAEVTIINRGKRLLEREHVDLSRRLQDVMESEGVRVLHASEVTAFPTPHSATIQTASGTEEVRFDECLLAIGRDESVKGMDAEVAGIAVDEHGVLEVDDHYRTTNPLVSAVGDAMGREKLSHGAEMHNRDLIYNDLVPFGKTHSLANFSWVTFTDPEIATFGYTADQLRERGREFETIEQAFTDDDRAITADYADVGKLILYVERRGLLRGKYLVGGTMIAPAAGEMIQELQLAMQEGVSLNAIFSKIYAYPVASRINQKAVFEDRRGKLGAVAQQFIRGWWRWRAG